MYGALDISTSGMVAERTRLEVISANLANARTILDTEGRYDPYHRRSVEFAAGDGSEEAISGVRVAAIRVVPGPLRLEYEPSSPYANADGYVGYPNVDPIVEQMNAMEAQRAYEANIAAAEATKSMMSVVLQLLV